MFGLGMGELLIILAVLLIFVGPSALPGMAKSIGKGVRELRKATNDLKSAAMEDEDIGSTVRELQSALRGDPTRPAPSVTAGRTIGKPGASPVAAPAAPVDPVDPADPPAPTVGAADAPSDAPAPSDTPSASSDPAPSIASGAPGAKPPGVGPPSGEARDVLPSERPKLS